MEDVYTGLEIERATAVPHNFRHRARSYIPLLNIYDGVSVCSNPGYEEAKFECVHIVICIRLQ